MARRRDPRLTENRRPIRFESTLGKFGFKVIHLEKSDAVNPDQHNDMTMVFNPATNTIIQMLQSSFFLYWPVLRAAKVMVDE